MINNAYKPIILIGKAALDFANSLFRPTREETERRDAVIEKINREVAITEHENGFSADISWLDLSFLDENKSYNLILSLDMKLKTERVFVPFAGVSKTATSIFVNMNPHYEEPVRSVFLPCAA